MVSSASEEATAAGVEILAAGGNAVDAAVAVGFALSVTLPQAGNLGGGGFMTIRMADGRMTTIDFRETAPAAATRDMYLDSAGNFLPSRAQLGALAVGVPGSPAGLLLALEKYGTLDRQKVIAPSIRLADAGFTVHPDLARDIADKAPDFRRFPSSAAIFSPTGKAIAGGDLFRQPDLAATLRRISSDGAPGA
jgi:gamma-glutamyltranspeptidase/glutathione hydrolase